jgi:hypothetical protein
MASAYYRAMATCSMLKRQLEKETLSRQAMELCFSKIHQSLDRYKGHLINRIRFHMDRHHTEYVRKVRAARRKCPKRPKAEKKGERRSSRIQMEGMGHGARNDEHVDELCSMLEAAEHHPGHFVDTSVPPGKHDQSTQTEEDRAGVLAIKQ